MQGKQLLAAAVAAVTAGIAQADDAAELNPVTVTASRNAQSVQQSLSAVSVISREDIERLQPQSVLDLLRGQAGVDIARNGGLGGSTSVFLRGTNSDHVLVLIDGVRAAAAGTGTFNWAQLNPAQIERIEIVRGPMSTLYGSDAIGGVIQIFTRDSQGASIRAEAGTHETYRLEGGIGGGDDITWSVNASSVESGGFSATNPDNFSFDPDDDGYEENSLTAGLGGPLGEDGKFSVRTWASDGEVEFDRGVTETKNNTTRARFQHQTLDNWQQTFTLGNALDERVTDSSFPSDITTKRSSLGWQNDIALAESLRLTAGLDYYEDDGENVDPTTGAVTIDESIDNLGLYANLDAKLGANSFNLGARRDDHSAFGTETTGQIAYGRDLTESLRLFGSFGTGFKAPTFNELFFPGFGNPALEAETSDSAELGVKFRPDSETRLRASVYETRVENLIEAVVVQPPFGFEARNVAEATIRGLEIAWDRNFGKKWSTGADLTYQDAVNDTTGEKLLRRPDEKLGLRVTRYFGTRGSLTAQAVYKGERQDTGGVTLDSYTLVNLGFNYGLTNSLTLEARVENALDEDYELVSGYNTSGAAGYLGLRFTP